MYPQREGGRGLGKEAMGGSNRNKKPSVLRLKRDSAGTEAGQGEARDQRPLPFYGDLPCEALDLGKRIQKSTQDSPWLRAAVSWLLPQAQTQHPRICISPEFFMNGASWRKLPAVCRDQNMAESGNSRLLPAVLAIDPMGR